MINLNTAVPLHNPNNNREPGRQIFNRQELIEKRNAEHTNFSGMDLSGLHLSKMDLRACNFSGANLRECCITNCELDDADFSGADLSNAKVKKCTGTGIMMDEACLENVLFEECNFCSSSFSKARLGNASMSSCIFLRSNFEKSDLSNVAFKNCDFEQANFQFASAKKRGKIWDCAFRDVSWQWTSPKLLFWGSSFQGVDFTGCDLGNSEFASCAFRGPIELERCSGLNEFVDTTFDGVNFLPLVDMPAAWTKLRGFEQHRAHYERYRTQWTEIVKWTLPEGGQPTLSIDLNAYLQHISTFDALTRQCLREKATTQMSHEGPGMETDRARMLYWKIMRIDDALTDAADAEKKGTPAKSVHEAWPEGGTKKEATFSQLFG